MFCYPLPHSCVELLPCIFAILASHAPRLPDCLTHITREDREKLLLKSMSGALGPATEACRALLTGLSETLVPGRPTRL